MKLLHESLRDAVKGTLTVVGIESHLGDIKRELYQELRRVPRRRTHSADTPNDGTEP
jgi:hypothetical protein